MNACNVGVLHGGHFDVDVDPVKERAADSLAVFLDVVRAAPALAFQVAKPTARTWMRCLFAGQHYVGFVAPKVRILLS